MATINYDYAIVLLDWDLGSKILFFLSGERFHWYKSYL